MRFHPDKYQTDNQLKKKFNKLSKSKGTGDHTMPVNVQEADEIRCLIIEKSEGITGSEDEPFTAEEVENEKDKVLDNTVKEREGAHVGNDANKRSSCR